MNGTRGRERDDDDDQGGHDYDQGKRINLELQQGPNHYVRRLSLSSFRRAMLGRL